MMKTIGLLGGMSWESTAVYYRLLNEEVTARLGGLHSAPCILYSVDFAPIEHYQQTGNWDQAARELGDAAQCIEKAGADCLLLCTNTMHKVFDQIQQRIRIPMIHIADPTAAAIKARHIETVGLLGTKYTMEQEFYRLRLERAGIRALIPGARDRDIINRVIFAELCLGVLSAEAKREYLRIITELQSEGAQGVILGCTEIGMLVTAEDTDMPLFDTSVIHARAAVAFALE